MKLRKIVFGWALVAAASLPAAADPCQLNLITHGTFHIVSTPQGSCLQFLDDTAVSYEIVNPKGSWREGLTGTIYAEMPAAGSCGIGEPVRVCNFDADFSRNIVGTLIFKNFIECPGYYIQTSNQDYLIRNCDDFGTELCDPANLGRRLKAEVFVDTGVSICLGAARSTVIDFDFFQ